jgi:hypothetical protein
VYIDKLTLTEPQKVQINELYLTNQVEDTMYTKDDDSHCSRYMTPGLGCTGECGLPLEHKVVKKYGEEGECYSMNIISMVCQPFRYTFSSLFK